jgi:predicted deacylase
MNKKLILGIGSFVLTICALGLTGNNKPVSSLPLSQPPPITRPLVQSFTISNPKPSYQDYDKIVQQLKTWNRESASFTEVGTYGKSTAGKDLYYFKMGNQGSPYKVLITGCIHGNEPLSTSTVMNYIGTLLASYGREPAVTELLNSREVYFIPVISPDSYPHSRHVDGVDPNRDFPGLKNKSHVSVKPIQAVQSFFSQHQFRAVISGHTFGRIYLIPYGDQMVNCPNYSDYQRIVGKMRELSGYDIGRACDNYGRPIYGSEVDWYYKHGAYDDNGRKRGAFAIVMEFGTHQVKPSDADIKVEFDKTYQGVLHFIKEAPLVDVVWEF